MFWAVPEQHPRTKKMRLAKLATVPNSQSLKSPYDDRISDFLDLTTKTRLIFLTTQAVVAGALEIRGEHGRVVDLSAAERENSEQAVGGGGCG